MSEPQSPTERNMLDRIKDIAQYAYYAGGLFVSATFAGVYTREIIAGEGIKPMDVEPMVVSVVGVVACGGLLAVHHIHCFGNKNPEE